MEIRLRLKTSVDVRGRGTGLEAPLVETLSLLNKSPVSEDELCNDLASRGAGHLLPQLYFHIERYRSRGWLDYTVCAGAGVIARVVPRNGDFKFLAVAMHPQRKFQLSRFAFLRREGPRTVWESPLCEARVIVDDAVGTAIAAALCEPCTLTEASARLPGAAAEHTAAWFELLAAVSMLEPEDSPEPPLLATWEFHDALFHHATRTASSIDGIGATERFDGKLPQPAGKNVESLQEWVELEEPQTGMSDAGPLFWDVLERRRSRRAHLETPMPRATFSEFLYRVARIQHAGAGAETETISRRYPGAGGLYEIEFYLAVNSCERVERGLYHYNPSRHALARRPASEAQLDELLADAARSWTNAHPPQVLVILSSRFARIAWTYERIAYRLTLLDAGVIIQTMYLAATALGLAPCAFGWGNSALFARAAGLDPFEEGSIAEFALGLPE